jgi:Flp pilus assembly pilin Flp
MQPWTLIMTRRLVRFFRNTDAASAVEYAVMLALILMAIYSAIALLGQKTSQAWASNNASLEAVNFGS